MDVRPLRGVREGPVGWRVGAVAIASLVAVVALASLIVALAPPPAPGSVLTGTTWQWTRSTSGSGALILVVPDSSKYTVVFRPDLTFRATTDCVAVTGTYTQVSSGRTGSSWTGLTLKADPYSLASCSAASLSPAYLQGLLAGSLSEIGDSTLSIWRAEGVAMTFKAAGSAATRPLGPAARPLGLAARPPSS
jgi:hypothetical protein